MANPEQGNDDGNLTPGTWALAEIEIPPVLDDIRLTIDNVAQLLLAVLNFLATILNAARAFTLSFLDPLTALVEGLIDLLESTIRGIQNTGIYLHGDFYLLKDAPEFRKLLGGYSAYERRMLNRLLDPADPNRPDFDRGTTSLTFFFYVNSGDISGILKVLTFLIGFMKLFGVESKTRVRSLGTVTDVRVKYGSEGTQGVINKPLFEALIDRQKSSDTPKGLKQAGEPDLATLEWRLAAAPGNFVSPVANLGPGGFYVEVSVDPIPYFIQYDVVPKGSVQKKEEKSESTPTPNRVRGLCVDGEGNTIQITGGVSQIDFFNAGSDFFSVEEGEPRAFLFKSTASTEQIPLAMGIGSDDRGIESKQYLQKTFFVSNADAGGILSGTTLTYTIKHSDMPLRATFDEDGNVKEDEATLPDSFYVRIRPVGDAVGSPDELGYGLVRGPFLLGVAPISLSVRNKDSVRIPDETITSMDRGEASSPIKITYPGADTGQYLRCVFTATLILALVRPDLLLAEDDEGKPITDLSEWGPVENKARKLTGLEDLAVIMLPKILGVRNSEQFFKGSFKTSVRINIYKRCAALTARLYRENNPAASIQKLVVERCQDLIDFTFEKSLVFDDTDSLVLRDMGLFSTFPVGDDDPRKFTIIQAMLSDNAAIGIGMNPTSVGSPDKNSKDVASQLCADTNNGNIPGYWLEHFYEKVTEAFDEALATRIEAENFDITLLREEDVNSSAQLVVQGSNPLISGSVINSPVCYVRRGPRVTKITYCRNIFEELYESAAFALGVANGPLSKGTNPDGKWITVRLGMMIPALDMFLDSIISWMKALVSAGNSIGKTIRQFIDYAQARIIELQTLIQRINSLLQNLFSIFGDLPAAAVLTVISQGSEGIIEGLMTAQDKPGDGPGSYSAGAVVVMAAPTLFTFFLELLSTDD